MEGWYHWRTKSTIRRIGCTELPGIILRFIGIYLWIDGTRSPEYSIMIHCKPDPCADTILRIGVYVAAAGGDGGDPASY